MDPTHIGVAATAVVGVITGLVSAYLTLRKSVNEEDVRRESFIVEQLKAMMARQDEEFESRMTRQEAEYKARIAELRRERDDALARLSICLTDYASSKERIIFYETLLYQNKVRYRPWVPPSQGGSQPIMDTIQDE